jgi:CRISPR-associated protein Csn2
MILKIFSFENDIDFSKNHINVLQIQNKKLFAKMVSSFNNMCKGLSVECDEVITLLEQDEIVDFTKNVLFVVDFLNFDFNQRRIQTVLYQYIDKIIKLEPEILSNINNLQDSIHIEFMSIMEEFPFEILCKKDSSILDILKMYGIRIKANVDEKIIEKLFKLVELVQCLDLAKLIILVNVKQYLDSDEIVEFYKYCVYNNVKLLVLERGLEVSPLERERILFVDENFDEFFIQ